MAIPAPRIGPLEEHLREPRLLALRCSDLWLGEPHRARAPLLVLVGGMPRPQQLPDLRRYLGAVLGVLAIRARQDPLS
eukprot:3381139-Prymnesium_polylepis.2